MADRDRERALRDAERYRALSQLEPRQDDAEHQVEALPLLAEELELPHWAGERHRCACVPAEPESDPRAARLDTLGTAVDDIEAGAQCVGPCGAGAHDVRGRVARARDERLLRCEPRLTVRALDLRHGSPEMRTGALLAEGERRQLVGRHPAEDRVRGTA